MKAIFPIGLTVIGLTTIALMYFLPFLILGIFVVSVIVTAIFIGYVVNESENTPESDQDFDVKFRKENEK